MFEKYEQKELLKIIFAYELCTSLEYMHYIKVSCEFLDALLYFTNIKIMSS